MDRTDSASVIPDNVARDIMKGVAATNPLLQLARRLPDMPTSRTRMPVISALATAYFVAADTGLKQTTEIAWANKYIDAEELAVIVPIPEAVLDDAGYDIWAEVRPEIVNAINFAINRAVLFGTGIPASWTTNLGGAGLLAVITAAGHAVDQSTHTGDLYDEIMGATGVIAKVEEDGFMVDGHIASLSLRGQLRGFREQIWNGTALVAGGSPIFVTTMQETTRYALDGAPIYFPTDGSIDPAVASLFSGQWDQLVWAMRQDITFKILDQAVITDAGGLVIYNLPQQDMVALRAVIRLGFALPNPINRVNQTAGTRLAFSALVP
jgi:HK97 family phage major capsid protein